MRSAWIGTIQPFQSEENSMELLINGQNVEVPNSVTTVSELLAHFGLEQKVVIVELNQQILEKSSHAEARITKGDRIEMVHFVGGG
jgi:sulfur carrier protein